MAFILVRVDGVDTEKSAILNTDQVTHVRSDAKDSKGRDCCVIYLTNGEALVVLSSLAELLARLNKEN